MLSLIIFLPVIVGIVLASLPGIRPSSARWIWVVTAAVVLVLVVMISVTGPQSDSGLRWEERLNWMPGVGTSYHVGVDGFSLPMLLLTAVVFLACALWALRDTDRPRAQAALLLFLETTCLGLFAAQDLILFFLFFDLSIVGMYFVIAGWGHGDQRRSALRFFLYTFLGSLALLLGFIGAYLLAEPHTFDIVELGERSGASGGVVGGAVLAAIVVGLAVKTPTIPFHSWLPPAHTDAPAIGSVVLAALLLKMGTYGFVRIAMPLLPSAWRSWAWVVIIVGLISVLFGALVAMAQTNIKRMIAYTSINHMGYIIVAIGTAGLVAGTAEQARQLAITGAVVQMVSHGLITGALFLLAGVFHSRRNNYQMDAYGGLAAPAPRLAGLFGIAAFASLGIPGFSGFIAEFQILSGSVGATAIAAFALPGIVITAALMLRALQRVFTGPSAALSIGFTDVSGREAATVGGLLALALLIGVLPGPLLHLISPAAVQLSNVLGR